MLRFYLPPNLAAAAPRDAIALRVETDLTAPDRPDLLPALALLQRWSTAPTPPRFIQLTRAQLREMISVVVGQPIFFWVNHPEMPISWNRDQLTGVSNLLWVDPSPSPPRGNDSAPTSAPLPSRSFGSRSGSNAREANRPPALSVDGSEHFLALTLPSRESPAYPSAVDLVKASGFSLEPSNRKWWLRDRHKVLNFLAVHGARLREEFGAEFTPNFERNTAHLATAQVVTEAIEAGGGGFALTVGLRAGRADEATLRSAVVSNRGYVEADGKIFLLEPAQLGRLANAQRALDGGLPEEVATHRSFRISPARFAEVQEILEELSPSFQPPATWRARSEALRNLSTLAPAPLPSDLRDRLRPYQRLGVAWLWHLYQHQLGGILADEMGLGKTPQALGFLSALLAQPRPDQAPSSLRTGRSPLAGGRNHRLARRPALVICPASLLENWRREGLRFTPELRIFVHHGENRLSLEEDFATIDVIITSYGTLARDREQFASMEFECVIADEAQHIKNRRSQNAAAMRALQARGRFLLTGTPLENSLDDLRSLFEFLLPGYLKPVPPGVRGEERAWFDQRLRAQTAPYILRRTKQSVAPELPAKLEQVIWCELTAAQAKLYRAMQEKSEQELFALESGGASEAKVRLATFTTLLRLRQICCDPRLVAPSESAAQDSPRKAEPGAPAAAPLETSAGFQDSAKLEAFRELLDEAIDDGHRVLVFSQFTSLLALLRAELDEQGVTYCYLDGSMSSRARQSEVDRFQAQPNIPVFLLSLKAGGTGLNLTGADTVVHFDPWWNPAVEAQATDRAHRIGQTRIVTSYKLVATNTVEEKVLGLQEEKRALLAGVFDASDAASAKLSLNDLKSLLRTTV